MKKLYSLLALVVGLFLGFASNGQSTISSSGIYNQISSNDTASFTISLSGASYVSFSTYLQTTIADPILVLQSLDGSNVFSISDNAAGLQSVISDVFLSAGTYTLLYVDKALDGDANHELEAVITPMATFLAGVASNDTICNAFTLDFDSVYTNQSNQYASAERIKGEANLNGALANSNLSEESIANSLWYTFTGTSSDIHSVKLSNVGAFGADAAVQVAIYEGTCNDFTNLRLINSFEVSTNPDSLLTFCLTEGTTYYVLVDGVALSYSTFDITLDTYELPEFALLVSSGDTNTRVGSLGPLCPADTIVYEAIVKLVNATDSSAVSSIYQAYINSLVLSVVGFDSVTGTATNTFGNLVAGNYTINARDICGVVLSKNISFVDTVPDPVSITISDLMDADCLDNGSRGSVVVEVEGGIINAGPLPYTPYFLYNSDLMGSFSIADNFNTATPGTPPGGFMNLSKGIYRIYYEDACGTYDSVQFVINNPEYNEVNIDSLSGKNPICVGNNDGSLTINATGGQGAGLDIVWYYSAMRDTANLFNMANIVAGETKSLIDTIEAGLYAVVVADLCTDSNGVNRDTLLLSLFDPKFDTLEVGISSTAPTTYNSADGSAVINKTGGSTLDSVKWYFNGTFIPRFENNLMIDSLSQGYYRAEYRDACLDTNVVFEFNLFATLSNDNICNAIAINVGDSIDRFSNVGSGIQAGEENISIPVNPVTGWSAENKIQSSVWFSFVAPNSGSVNVTVKTANYPFINRNFDPQVAIFGGDCNNIPALQLLSANDNSTHPAAAGNDNNSYQRVNCLTPGTVYYILIDGFEALGEEGIFTIDLTTNVVADVTISSNLNTIDCNNPTATLVVDQPFGGVGALTTTFDGDTLIFNAGTATVNGINPGTYDLIVYDTCGIVAQKVIEVEGFANRPFEIDFDITKATCPMGNDAAIDFQFGGGASVNNYFITIRNDAGTIIRTRTATDSTFTATNFSAGDYQATLEDNCTNEKEFVFTIEETVLEAVTANIETIQPVCNGATGSASVTVNGGSGIFFYNVGTVLTNLDVPSAMTRDTNSFMLENLAVGTYYVFIREFCEGNTFGADTALIDTIKIVSPMLDPLSIKVTKNNPSANGLSDGSFSFSIMGGLQPYTFNAFTFVGGVKVDTLNIVDSAVTNLSAGVYRIEYSDSCTSGVIATTVTLLNPPANNTACGATLLTLGTTVSGNNQASSLSANDAKVPAPGNNASCFVQGTWCSNDGITAPLWYKFAVPASGNVVIELNSNVFDPQLAIYSVDNCADGANFQLLGASDDLSTTNDDSRVTISCLNPGDTLYALVDVNEVPVAGVRGSFSIRAADNNNAKLNVLQIITNASTNLTKDGRIDINIIGGAAPYTVVWADNASAPEDRIALATGTYTVTVTDACGATVTKNIFVDFNERSNDRPCTAQALLLNSTIQVSTVKAKVSAGEPAPSTNGTCSSADVFSWCENDGINNTVWYTFTAPQSGMVSLSTCNNDSTAFDTQIAVYSSSSCSDFTSFNLLAANDDNIDDDACNFGASRLTVKNLTPCATYYVQVDSKGATGIANLTINAIGGTTPNAGESNSSIACFYDTAFDLKTLVSAGADTNGVFVDSTNSNVLTGSVVDVTKLDTTNTNTFVFYYVVGEQCNGSLILGDAAALTLIVDRCVGITETEGSTLNVYPNPSSTEVFVNNAKSDEIYIMSNEGKVLMTQISKESNRFDISNLAAGVYTVVAGNERVRLLKQ